MREVKCHIRNITDQDHKTFKNSTCLLTISIGQETHEDNRFAATMEMIKQSFKGCTIALHDVLQRHTIALAYNKEASNFYDMAIAAGDSWLERNKEYLSNSAIPINVLRWDSWLSDPDYEKHKSMVLAEIKSDDHYREQFDLTIDDYLSRYCRRLEKPLDFDKQRAHRLCLDYLIEECAVMCLWPNSNCQYELYPSKHNAAMEATRIKFLEKENKSLIKGLAIAFNHRPNQRQQIFEKTKRTEKIS